MNLPFEAPAYAEAVRVFEQTRGRAARVPTYDVWAREWAYLTAHAETQPYVTEDFHVLPLGPLGLPLQVLHAIEDPTGNTVIPTVFLEDDSADVMGLLLDGVSDVQLAPWNLRYEAYALPLPQVSVDNPLRRYRRYLKLVTDVECEYGCTSKARAWVDDLLPSSMAYWQSRGIPSLTRSDHTGQTVFDLYRGGTFDAFLTLRVRQGPDVAVGHFLLFDDQCYWSSTFHGAVSHLGNNVLLTALEVLRRSHSDVRWLNLGVGYFSWKYEWSDRVVYQPGLRFLDGTEVRYA